MATGSLLCGSIRTVKLDPPLAKPSASKVCLPSLSFASGRTFFGSSIILSSKVGEARSSSRSAAATRMPDIGRLAPLSSIT